MELYDVISMIKSANTIALFSHINPDCDTLGSSLALRLFLLKMGKKVSVYCDGELKFDLKKLYSVEAINADEPQRSYDLTIGVDCATFDRIGKYTSVFLRGRKTLCIDHHMQDVGYAQVNYIEPDSGATAELIYLILKQYDESAIDSHIAGLLYTSLVTDTGNFGFSNTSARTLKIASELVGYDIHQSDISFTHFRELPLNTFKLKAIALSKAQFFEDNRIGVLTFLKEDMIMTGTTPANTSNLVNEVANVSGVEVAISITETHRNTFKVSIRTHGDVDANQIAMTFGGGGHKNASGCVLNGFYGNVLDDLLKAAKDHL